MAGVTRGRKRSNDSVSKDEPKSKKGKLAGKKSANKKTSAEKNGKMSPNPKGTQNKKGSSARKTIKKIKNGISENGGAINKSPKSRAKNGLKSSKKVSETLPPSLRKPPRFSWVATGMLAGHGRPTLHGHVQYLVEHGFKYIVTLTQNKPRTLREYLGGLEWIHIPIQDEKPPSIDQIQQFCDAVHKARSENVALSVHCAWGRGRTGTMLACFLAQEHKLPATEAITKIREIRPGSIDTEHQAAAVHAWVDSL